MAEPSQNTGIDLTNLADSILTQADKRSGMFSRVLGYVKDSWSNRRWALDLEQREKDLTERLVEFDKNSRALVKRKAVLSDKRQALEAMALEIKEGRVSLQCAKDTFRAERQALRDEAIEEAKVAAQSECAAIRERAIQSLLGINIKIEQREAELFSLEAKLRNLQEMLTKVTETLSVGLKECTQENKDAVGFEGRNSKPMYLVYTNTDEEVTASPVANQEGLEVETAGWTASLFSTETEEQQISSSAMITSAACFLRAGG